MPDPIAIGAAINPRLAGRIESILAARGLQPASPEEIDASTPDDPGHPEYHRRRRAEYALSRWAVATPPRYQRAAATEPQIIAWATAVIDEPDTAGGLLITGTTGTGKTHQAFGAMRMIAESGPRSFQLIATTTADMYGDLRPTANVGQTEGYLTRLCEIPLLLLDDLGSAKATEWTEEVTYRVINHRYNHCLPTLFTSNLPPKSKHGPDLTAALGDRIVSRLAEMVTTVPMAGVDRRRSA